MSNPTVADTALSIIATLSKLMADKDTILADCEEAKKSPLTSQVDAAGYAMLLCYQAELSVEQALFALGVKVSNSGNTEPDSNSLNQHFATTGEILGINVSSAQVACFALATQLSDTVSKMLKIARACIDGEENLAGKKIPALSLVNK